MNRLAIAATLGSLATVLVPAGEASAYPRPGRVELITQAPGGLAQDAFANEPSASYDGSLVAFTARSGNLVPGDTNGQNDIFVRNRVTKTTTRVSVSTDGAQSDGYSFEPDLAAGGRFVAFTSAAENLAENDGNGFPDVFVHDLQTGNTELVSVNPDNAAGNVGGEDPAISADGRFVAFTSWSSDLVEGDMNDRSDIFVRDRLNGTTELVSESERGKANDRSFLPEISADGARVAFVSQADNLVDDDTNGLLHTATGRDVFVHDRTAGTLVRASVGSDDGQANGRSSEPVLSGDGRFVAFESEASNLVPNDDNWKPDIFVRDLEKRATVRVSLNSSASAGSVFYNGGVSISHDGRQIAFATAAQRMAPEDPVSSDPALVEAHLGSGLTQQIYVHDTLTGATERVSNADDGTPGDFSSDSPALSGDGRVVAFVSAATNLWHWDSADSDIFVRERGPAFGVGWLDASQSGSSVITGSVRFDHGAMTSARAPSEPADLIASWAGVELAEARIMHRPEEDDLLFTIGVPHMPGVRPAWGGPVRPTVRDVPLNPWTAFSSEVVCPTCFQPSVSGLPGIGYGFSFTVDDRRFEVRAERVGDEATPRFSLRSCTPACVGAGILEGGFGTAGELVRVSLPLAILGTGDKPLLGSVSAFTTAGTGRHETILRRLELPALQVDEPRLEVGFANGDAGPDSVTFQRVNFHKGIFSVTASEDGPFEHAWLRLCLADRCTVDRRSL